MDPFAARLGLPQPLGPERLLELRARHRPVRDRGRPHRVEHLGRRLERRQRLVTRPEVVPEEAPERGARARAGEGEAAVREVEARAVLIRQPRERAATLARREEALDLRPRRRFLTSFLEILNYQGFMYLVLIVLGIFHHQ